MAKTAAKANQGELVYHIGSIRMRLTGSGSLDMQLNSLDDIITSTLVPFTMAPTTYIEPTRLSNFKSQRTQLEFSVDEIDEYFQIRKIIIFVIPTDSSYPSTIGG